MVSLSRSNPVRNSGKLALTLFNSPALLACSSSKASLTSASPPTLAAGPPAESTPQTFASMLNSHTKCTFALNLRVRAKHTNGSRRIHEYDRYDQAAFALEIGS